MFDVHLSLYPFELLMLQGRGARVARGRLDTLDGILLRHPAASDCNARKMINFTLKK
jgi:hypothetical protein